MPARQPSLFDTPLLPGLAHRPDLLSKEEEASLLASLAAVELASFKFQQWEGRRQVASFGWRYDFIEGRMSAAAPIPDFLLPLRARAAELAALPAAAFEHVLVTRYDPGAGIGWHRDRPVFEAVVGVSLGAPCTLRFRRRTPGGFERAALLAEPRSAYLLTGEARHRWEHGIAPLGQQRWSITFRSLSAAGLRAAGR